MKKFLKTILIIFLSAIVGFGSAALISRSFISKDEQKEPPKQEQTENEDDGSATLPSVQSTAKILKPYKDEREMVAYIKFEKEAFALRSDQNMQGGEFEGVVFKYKPTSFYTTRFTAYFGYRSTDKLSGKIMNAYYAGNKLIYVSETVYLPITKTFVEKFNLKFNQSGEATITFSASDWELTSEAINNDAANVGSADMRETYEWTAAFTQDYVATVYNYIPGE